MMLRTHLRGGAPEVFPGVRGSSGSRCRRYRLAVKAMYDPRFRFGPYNRRFRPNSGGSIDNSSWRDARAAKLREARQVGEARQGGRGKGRGHLTRFQAARALGQWKGGGGRGAH